MKRILTCLALCALLPFAVGAAPAPRTALRPRVTDAATGEAVAGATVVICETDARRLTDAHGDTPVVAVPYLPDDRLGGGYAGLTLIVYAPGYRPTVLIGCVVYPHRTRLGPEIPVFRDEGDASPLTVVETPPREWVEHLVRAFPAIPPRENQRALPLPPSVGAPFATLMATETGAGGGRPSSRETVRENGTRARFLDARLGFFADALLI